jgi:hypothetical protein
MPSYTLSAGVNTRIAQINKSRKYMLIANTGSATVNISKDMTASATGDIPILPNGAYEISLINPFSGEIYAYSASGTTIYVQENN